MKPPRPAGAAAAPLAVREEERPDAVEDAEEPLGSFRRAGYAKLNQNVMG